MTTPPDDEALQNFLDHYPPRPYHLRGDLREYPRAELALVNSADGLLFLNGVPPDAPMGSPRLAQDDDGENCHLWIIDDRGRPCISHAPLERLGNGKLHHTNLTGGASALIGGEIWFDEMPRIYLSGSSGRYPPNGPSHLEAAEQLFSAVGFDVLSLGWDDEAEKPHRVWRGKRRTGEE